MSHFSVALIIEEELIPRIENTGIRGIIEKRMAPYQENNMGTTKREYMYFHNSEEDERNIDKYENDGQKYIIKPDGERYLPWDSELQDTVKDKAEENKYGVLGSNEVIEFAKNTEGYKVKYFEFKEIFDSFEDFLESWIGVTYDVEEGAYGYWHNPNAKWDYWKIGGRFSGKLLVSTTENPYLLDEVERDISIPNNYVWSNIGKVKNINFEKMRKIKSKEMEESWEEIQNKDENMRELLYGLKEDDTKEDYINRKSKFTTHAVVDKNGDWLERGEMGWWGIVVDEKEDEDKWANDYKETFLDLLEPDDVLVILDCHI